MFCIHWLLLLLLAPLAFSQGYFTYTGATVKKNLDILMGNDCYLEGGMRLVPHNGCRKAWLSLQDLSNCWQGGTVHVLGGTEYKECWPNAEKIFNVFDYKDDCLAICYQPQNTSPEQEVVERKVVLTGKPKAHNHDLKNNKESVEKSVRITGTSRTETNPFEIPENYGDMKKFTNLRQTSNPHDNWFSDMKNGILLAGWSGTKKSDVFNFYNLKHSSVEDGFQSDICELPDCEVIAINGLKLELCKRVCKGTKLQFVWKQKRETKAKIDISKDLCRHKRILKEEMLSDSVKSNSFDAYWVCNNGTFMKVKSIRSGVKNCTSVYLNKQMIACEKTDVISYCKIDDVSTKHGKFIFTISTQPRGPIVVHTDVEDRVEECPDKCSIVLQMKKFATITCHNGDSAVYRASNDLTTGCPFISNVFTSEIAATVCRMTFRPSYFWATISWIGFGYLAVSSAMLLIKFLIFKLIDCVRAVRDKMNSTIEVCQNCEQYIDYQTLKKHHYRCTVGICPYCKQLFEKGTLSTHSCSCVEKKRMINSARLEQEEKNINKMIHKSIVGDMLGTRLNKAVTVMIGIILAIMVILPVSEAFEFDKTELVVQDEVAPYIDTMNKRIEECNPGCWWIQEVCTCGSNSGSRRLLSEPNTPVRPPKGFFHPSSTFSVASNPRVLDLTIGSSETKGDKVLINGESVTIMPIEDHNGILWEIKSPESDEKMSISIGILEAYQEYNAVFRYYSSDRKIEKNMEMACTGDCSSSCGCKSSTCNVKLYTNDRNWNCNPDWCWAINQGCTCCTSSASIKPGYVFSYWDLDYSDTKVTLCFKMSDDKFICNTMEDNSEMTIGDFEFKIVRAFGIDKKLPKKVVAVHEFNDHVSNFAHPISLLLDPELCDRQSCKHGEIGDFTFTNLNFLVNSEKETNSDLRMVWDGVGVSRNCRFGKEPTCSYDYVAEDISAIFKNKIKVSKNANDQFYLKEFVMSELPDATPDLKLRVLPIKGSGQIELLLKVKGLELTKKTIKPKLGTFEIRSCEGCRGCHHGFSCAVSVSLIEPESYMLHLISPQKSVSVDTGSIEASQLTKTLNVSLFTGSILEKVELCLVEFDVCKSIQVSLTEPVLTAMPDHDNIIHVSDNNMKGNWFDQFKASGLSLGLGMGDLLVALLFSKFFLIVVMISAVIFLIVFLGPIRKIFRICIPRRFRARKTFTGMPEKVQDQKPKYKI